MENEKKEKWNKIVRIITNAKCLWTQFDLFFFCSCLLLNKSKKKQKRHHNFIFIYFRRDIYQSDLQFNRGRDKKNCINSNLACMFQLIPIRSGRINHVHLGFRACSIRNCTRKYTQSLQSTATDSKCTSSISEP